MFGRAVPLMSVLLASMLVIGGAVGIAVLYRQVDLTMSVAAWWNMALWQPDGVTPLVSIDFGTLYRDKTSRYPELETEFYILENTGEADYLIYYTLTDFPEDVILTLYGGRFGMEKTLLAEGVFYSHIIETEEGGMNTYSWYFTITADADAVEAEYTPVFKWNADDGT